MLVFRNREDCVGCGACEDHDPALLSERFELEDEPFSALVEAQNRAHMREGTTKEQRALTSVLIDFFSVPDLM